MPERRVTVAVLIEYKVEGDAAAVVVGQHAVSLLPDLPQFHIRHATICTPAAVGILRADEGPASEQFGYAPYPPNPPDPESADTPQRAGGQVVGP